MNEISHIKVEPSELSHQVMTISEPVKLNNLLDMVPDIVMILNSQRQIIYCNISLLNFLGYGSQGEVIGKRPGEVLNCIHAFENEYGCGSTEFCNECGVFKAIVSSLDNKKDIQECRIIQKDTGNAFDLKVWSNPVFFSGNHFIMFSVMDISSEKIKEILEQIFFHDILNIASSIKSLMEILEYELPEQLTNYKSLIKNFTTKLLEEIKTQRQLVEAETSSLILELNKISAIEIIQGVINLVKQYDFSKNVNIQISSQAEDFIMITDVSLLGRVLTNLLKNACEVENPDGCVTIGFKVDNGFTHFWIHNISVMPRTIQLQLFQRSFSTKGKGRGIGLYSVKLLTEKYLKGKVDFISSKETGTIFNLYYPLSLEE